MHKSLKTQKKLIAALLSAFIVTGCAIGPNYKQPDTAFPKVYPQDRKTSVIDTHLPADIESISNDWWRGFNDSALNDMVNQALLYNQDLAEASARVDESAAQARIARNTALPQINSSSAGSRGKSSEHTSAINAPTNNFNAAATISWELDIWGALRRSNESARARYLASSYTRDALQLSLTAQVAQTYFQLRAYDELLNLSKETIRTREQSLGVQTKRFKEGFLSKVEVAQAQAELAGARLNGEKQALAIQTTETSLSVLLGRSPREFLEKHLRAQTINTLPKTLDVPMDLPANLILRRPDVASAEQQLIAANAEIGMARAAYFPSIGLTGSLGSNSPALSQLFSGPAAAWSFVGSLAAPIFNFGTTQANVNAANARQKQALAAYQKVIQMSFKETLDVFNSQSSTAKQMENQLSQVAATQEALKLLNLRYEAGYSGFFEVLETERGAYAAQVALIDAQLAQLNAQVNLYKALGGGWHIP